MALRVEVDGRELTGSWTDENPETRDAVAAALPLSGEATRWGDELYVRIPVDVPPENTRAEVPVGGVAYWPRGNALCLFWGPTPASEGDQPRAASPVSVVAELDDVDPLSGLEGGARVSVQQR